jgi:hypothetical protein
MDPSFFQIILLLAGASFDEVCPPLPGHSSKVVGAVLSKRKAHTRIEIWLGGMEPLPAVWIKAVEAFVNSQFPKEKTFGFSPFGEPSKRSVSGAAGDRSKTPVPRFPSMGHFVQR